MIPGPIELSPGVLAAFSGPPPSHTASDLIAAFGRSLENLRRVWLADDSSQPFVVAGGGTVGMEMAVANLVEGGERVLVVNSGYFSDRLAEMLRRQGAEVHEVTAPAGSAPGIEEVEEALEQLQAKGEVKALFATHVDTSTGVLVDPEPLARLARERGVLSVFDGVCATAAERFEMAAWEADVYLTGSQKALGLPPGLALLVASGRALEARAKRAAGPPPMYFDWGLWRPIMEAYEERRPSYFSTPATNLVLALDTGLQEILEKGMEERFGAHRRAAEALRRAWEAMGLESVPQSPDLAAHSLSALYYPPGVDASLVGGILKHGVMVAGGLHPQIKSQYFRVGHMGYATERPDMLRRTVEAVARALRDAGRDLDPGAVVKAAGL
jgi:alanine-glyoxylate transaminase/serine-glyoxylate transaminase/serine-pyruvate transaminase